MWCGASRDIRVGEVAIAVGGDGGVEELGVGHVRQGGVKAVHLLEVSGAVPRAGTDRAASNCVCVWVFGCVQVCGDVANCGPAHAPWWRWIEEIRIHGGRGGGLKNH